MLNKIKALLIALAMCLGMTAVGTGVARADTYNVVHHRPISQIPTIRVWEGYADGHGVGDYVDLCRDCTTGYFDGPVDPNYFYIPTGWCAEINVYENGVYRSKARFGPGPKWVDTRIARYYSVYIHAPGTDGICN